MERAAPANPLTPRLVSSEAPTEQTQLCVRRRDGRNGVSPSSRLSAHHDTVYAAVSHDRRPTVVERATHARLLLLPPASFLACRLLRLRRVSPAGIPRPGWSLRRQSPAQLVDDGPRLFQLAFEGVRAFLRRFQRHALVFQRLQRARAFALELGARSRRALTFDEERLRLRAHLFGELVGDGSVAGGGVESRAEVAGGGGGIGGDGGVDRGVRGGGRRLLGVAAALLLALGRGRDRGAGGGGVGGDASGGWGRGGRRAGLGEGPRKRAGARGGGDGGGGLGVGVAAARRLGGGGRAGAGIAGRSRRARGGDDGPKRAVLGLGSAEEDSGDRYTITPPLEGGSTRRGPDVDIARPRARASVRVASLNRASRSCRRNESYWYLRGQRAARHSHVGSRDAHLRRTPVRASRCVSASGAMAGGKPAWLVNKIRAQASARKRASVGASVASSSNKKRSKVDDGASELPPPPPPVDPATLDRALATVSSRAPRLAAALLPFQREGVEFVLRKGGRALIAHDMGLGKTLQALAVLAHYSHEWPALVVVPASMRWPWVDALELWLDGLLRPGDVCVVRDGGCTSVAHPESKVVVVSYPLLVNPSIRAQVEAAKFRVVVADESHYLKDPKAKRTQALAPVLRRALRCVLLSGTPALNRPKDLFPQLDAIKPGGFGSFSDFARRYCDAKRLPWGWSFDGGSHLEELHRRLVDGYMHRRLKAVVADQLPPKRRERVRIELSGAAAAKMRAAHAELAKLATARRDASTAGANADANATGASSREARFEALRGLSAFGRATAEAKAADVAAHVAELVEGGTKLLFFAHHHVMLDAMENALRAARVPHVRVDGTTPSLERASAVRRFQEDSALRVAVLSIQACGQGLTLTAASDVVFGELHWVPSAMLQAEDRAHRMGQKNPVNVKYLCAAGTADDIVWPAIRRKLENLGRALDGEAATLGAEDVEGSSLTADGGVLAALMAHYAANSADASRFIAGPGGGRDFSSDDPSGGIHSRDIRAFFGAGATRRNRIRADGDDDDDENENENVHGVVDLTAEEKDDGARWACGACTFLNPSRAEACEMCDTRPPKASASRPSPSSSPSPPSSSPPPPSSSPPPPPSPPPSPSPRADLAFEVSGNTSRVFVHRRASADSKDEWVYAGARLTPGEFRAADTAGADEDLPEILRPAAARRACARFYATGTPSARRRNPR